MLIFFPFLADFHCAITKTFSRLAYTYEPSDSDVHLIMLDGIPHFEACELAKDNGKFGITTKQEIQVQLLNSRNMRIEWPERIILVPLSCVKDFGKISLELPGIDRPFC